MSDPIDCDQQTEPKNQKSDFVKVSGNILSNVNLKLGFFLFVISMLIFSDLFVNNVMSGIDGAVSGEYCTSKGTIIQITILIVCFLVLDLVIKYEWL